MEQEGGFCPEDLMEESGEVPVLPGCLKAKLHNWRKITTNCFILSILASGYRIEWEQDRSQQFWGVPEQCDLKNHPSCYENEAFTSKAVTDGVAMGAMMEIPEKDAWNIMPIHIDVRSKNGKMRFCHDCKFINRFIKNIKFKMEQLNKEGRTLFPDCTCWWVADLSQAYYHIEIEPSNYKYLCFRWNGKVYAMKVLPFGVRSAPRVFTMIVKEMLRYWREDFHIKVLGFIDDMIGGAETPELASAQSRFVVSHLRSLGWVMQQKKLVGIPQALSVIEGLGTLLDFSTSSFKPTLEKIAAVKSLAGKLRRSTASPTAETLSKLTGLIMCLILSLGSVCRIRTRSLYRNMAARWRPEDDQECPKTQKKVWKRHVHLWQSARTECAFWEENVESFISRRPMRYLHPPMVLDCNLHCDASKDGGGAHIQIPDAEQRSALLNTLLSNMAAKQKSAVTARQFQELSKNGIKIYFALTEEQEAESSTWREMYTVFRILLACGELLQDCSFKLHLDNASAVIALGGKAPMCAPDKYYGGSMNPRIHALVVKILDVAATYNMQFQSLWVPRELNVIADYMSHEWERSHYGYSLSKNAFERLDRAWGPHTIDCFSEAHNCRVASGRFNSQFFCEGSEWVDAFYL